MEKNKNMTIDIRKKVETLWEQLVILNSNLLVLKKIIKFPWHLFQPNPFPQFWSLILKNLYDMCILIIWRITENNSKRLSLPQVINEIKYSKIEGYLKDIDEIHRKVLKIRHGEIAHLGAKWMTDLQKRRQYLLSIDSMKKMSDNLTKIFSAICEILGFKEGREFVLWGLDKEIEKLLNNIVKESPLLRMPEEKPRHWEIYKKKLSSSDIDVLNQYRTKFGLSRIENLKNYKLRRRQNVW